MKLRKIKVKSFLNILKQQLYKKNPLDKKSLNQKEANIRLDNIEIN